MGFEELCYEGVTTSQNMPEPNPSSLRISPNGTYALSGGKTVNVYKPNATTRRTSDKSSALRT